MKVLLIRRAAFLACVTMAGAVPLSPAVAQSDSITVAAWSEQCSSLTSANFDQCCPNGKVEDLYGSAANEACTNAQSQISKRKAARPAAIAKPVPGIPPVAAAPPAGPVAGAPTGPAAAPDPDSGLGNPGNGKDVGRAGESPNGTDFGGGSQGKGDVGNKGGGNGGGKGGGSGGGKGGGNGGKGGGNGGGGGSKGGGRN